MSQGDQNSGDLSKGRILPHQHSTNAFLFLAIEVFGCLHQKVNNFFIYVLTWHGRKKAPMAL
jgi:hypothetical protein